MVSVFLFLGDTGLNFCSYALTVCLDLGLAQIYPVWDEDTEEERTVLRASFAGPYLLIIKDDQSLLLLQADESGDLDEVSISEAITSCSWLSGTLYVDKSNAFRTQSENQDGNPDVILFLLDTDHRLLVSTIASISNRASSIDHE